MRNNLKKRTLTGTKKVPGRKPILTEKKINLLGKTALKNSFDSSFTIFEKSNVLKNKTPSKTTCRKYLRAAGFKNHLAARKPHLTEFHARERLRVAQFIIDQPDSYIESLMPSDECKFNIAGNDGRVRIWREPNTRYDKHNILTTQKFGGGKSVMVWAVMSVHGLGNCVFLEKSVDTETYLTILKQNLLQTIKNHRMYEYFFLQDNAPAHRSEKVLEWFEKKGVPVMPWCAQSPDLNPIEHAWAYLKRKIGQKRHSTVDELKQDILHHWSQITPEFCKSLIMSMKRRALAIINASGYLTKY